MRCPYCPQEPETDWKYCIRCGRPTVVSPQESVNESTAEHQVTDEPSASHFTAPLGAVDLSSQAPARPVVPLANSDGDTAGPDAPAGVKDPEPAPREPRGARARRRARERALRAAGSEYYRSVRTLARALITVSALMTTAVVSLAVIFVYSMNRSQEHMMAMSKDSGAAYRAIEEAERRALQDKLELQARSEQLNDEKAGLKQENAGLKQENAELKQENARKEAELAKARVETLPARLNNRESREIDGALTAMLKTKGRNAQTGLAAHKSDVEALRQRVRNGEDRLSIYEDYTRLINKVDEQTRAKMEGTVRKVIMGE